MAGERFNSVLLTPSPNPIPLDTLAASLLRKSGHSCMTKSRYTVERRLILHSINRMGKQASDHPNTQLCHTRSLEPGARSVKDGTKGMTEGELSEQNPRRQELEDLYQQQFLSKPPPASGGVAGGASPLRFCPVQLELVRRRGGHWSLGTSSFPAPRKAQKRGGEIHCLWFGGRGRAAHQASRPGC